MSLHWRPLLLAALVAGLPAAAGAQPPTSDLGSASIEELMNMRVTIASRRSQRAEDVPAAVYVITRDAIQRSGFATLPDILRLAPGVQVAQVVSSRWAISIRGFNDLYSNKLLVLVDGRSVYTRTFSGVYWDLQDLMVSDIERIEVIRGPAGVAWGANAVNGVINIITRDAADTQGTVVHLSAGTFDRERVGVRHGGSFGAAAYRVYSQWSGHGASEPAGGTSFSDGWHRLTSGARVDWRLGRDAVLTQAQFTAARSTPGWLTLAELAPGVVPSPAGVSNSRQASVLASWTRTRASGAVFQLQGYHTYADRDEPVVALRERTSDVHAQYDAVLGRRHALVFGGGYRHFDVRGGETVTARLGSQTLHTLNVFAQDEITLRTGLTATLGAKVEHDTFGGVEFTPSGRVMWHLGDRQHLWGAVSRANRAPAVTDRDFRLHFGVEPGPLPAYVSYVGNPDYRREELSQVEAGYRARIGARASMDATVFHGRYDGLPTYEPLAPSVELTPGPPHVLVGVGLRSLLNARARGAEVSARWEPRPGWEVMGWYAYLDLSVDLDAGSLDAATGQTDGNAPAHQWRLGSSYAPRPGIQLSASLARSGRLSALAVPAHTRLDARAEFRVHPRITAAIVGQNLLEATHREFAGSTLFVASSMPRSARVDLRWAF
jgi:iron complex outermembrane receptor protein